MLNQTMELSELASTLGSLSTVPLSADMDRFRAILTAQAYMIRSVSVLERMKATDREWETNTIISARERLSEASFWLSSEIAAYGRKRHAQLFKERAEELGVSTTPTDEEEEGTTQEEVLEQLREIKETLEAELDRRGRTMKPKKAEAGKSE